MAISRCRQIKSFEHLVRSEVKAFRILRARRLRQLPKRRMQCPRCAMQPVYFLAEGRYRCGRCGYTFGVFTGTWLGRSRLPLPTWLWLVKLFELEVPALVAARQAAVSYPTALRAFTLMRQALRADEAPHLLELVGPEVEADESYFGGRRRGRRAEGKRGRGAPGKIPVFGILERRGRVTVTVVPNVSTETLLGETLRHVKRGSLIYTDRYRGYDTLALCGYEHLRVAHGQGEYGRTVRTPRGVRAVHINGLEGFWSYAKGKLAKHHGVAPHRFPLYLYEMQFRYNHRHEPLFERLLEFLVQPVPTT